MSNRELRHILTGLPADADFDAFCLDYFPNTRKQFGAGMDRTQRINLLIEREDPEALAGALRRAGNGPAENSTQAVFHVPQSLSPDFTGRKDTLHALRERLTARRMVALWGLGGLGKTQTALAYAHRHRGDYPVVLWLGGDTALGFEQGLCELGLPLHRAGHLGLAALDEHDPAAVRRAVLDYLRRKSDYLLVCDNLDAPPALLPVWPGRAGLSGQVLLTSRSRDCRRLGAEIVDLGTLPYADATAYLRGCHPPSDVAEEPALTELAMELGGLPLALAQAAAFLVAHDTRYDAYLRQYRKQPLRLLDEEQPPDYPCSVATTWAISLEHVNKASPVSLELFKLCAMLHPDAIPEEIFDRPVAALGKSLHAALGGEAGSAADPLALDRMLGPLLEHALVQRDRKERILSLHRLVQQAVLSQMPAAEQGRWAQMAVAQLDEVYPDAKFSHWSQCRRLLSQVSAIVEHIDRLGLIDRAAASLLHKSGRFLKEQAQYAEAEPLFRRALMIMEKARGGDHPDVAKCLNSLATLLKKQGKFAEAEPLHRHALAIREKALGGDHPDVAGSLNNLGRLLSEQGRFEEAEPLYHRALAIKEKALGSDHPDVAWSLNNLGLLLYKQGKFAEAEPLFRRALAIDEKALSGDHPDVAASLSNLGLMLCDQGQLEEAELLFRRALAIDEKVLPAGHPWIDELRCHLELLLAKRCGQG